MKAIRPTLIVGACTLALAGAAFAQTSGTTTTAAGTTVSTTSSTSSGATAAYLKRAESRFGTFAGSSDNVDSLAAGLRTGAEITLTGSGETATFTPPTKPMGYGNITRALDLAQRQLVAAGISDPTPKEIQAALLGGTISGPNGDVKFEGVLQLRSQGMGWGQIAHTIGVHPGMGKSETVVVPANSAAGSGLSTAGTKSGIVTAAGGSPASRGNGRALGASAGATSSAIGAGTSNAGGIGSAKGQGNAFGHAIK